ncbi:hypothetical protein, partial [Aeromonas veronii]|uniref:hypothetical protein n=1 Tax=Aeromonas veronii TaxID=654 RepID=UPI0038B4E08E
EKEIPPRRTVELPDSAVALFSIDNAGAAKPRPLPAEITACIVESNGIIVLPLVGSSMVRNDEL